MLSFRRLPPPQTAAVAAPSPRPSTRPRMGKGKKKGAGRASAASLEQRGFNVGQMGLAAAQRQAAAQSAGRSKKHGSRGKNRTNKMGSRGGKGGGGKKGRSASEDAIRKACKKGDVSAILSSELLAQALQQECSEETAALVLTLLVSHARLGEAARLLRDGVTVSLHNVVQALLSLPQLQRVEAAVALEFVEAAVAGRSSFAVRQLSSVLLEFISEANGAVDQMQSQPLASLVRQGRAAVGRLSAGQKQGEVLCERDEASRNSEARRGIQGGDCVAVGVLPGGDNLVEAEVVVGMPLVLKLPEGESTRLLQAAQLTRIRTLNPDPNLDPTPDPNPGPDPNAADAGGPGGVQRPHRQARQPRVVQATALSHRSRDEGVGPRALQAPREPRLRQHGRRRRRRRQGGRR